MGVVATFIPSKQAVDAAWELHCSYAQSVIDDPKLLLDRSFMEGATRAERTFRSTFLRFDAGIKKGAQRGS